MLKGSLSPVGGICADVGITRRAVLAGAGGVLACGVAPGFANTSSAGLPDPKREALRYEISYLGVGIGQQFLRFHSREKSLRVDSRTIMEIGLGPLTAYKYAQECREWWEDGRLVRLQAVTEEDGEESILSGVAVAEGFAVTLKDGTEIYPADLFTNNDVWTAEALRAPYIIDVRDGELLKQSVEQLGSERIDVNGKSVHAQGFSVQGSRLEAQLWYDPAILVRAKVTRGDHTITYHLSDGTASHMIAVREKLQSPEYEGHR